MESDRHMQRDRGVPASRSARRPGIGAAREPALVAAKPGLAVTQVCLSRSNVILIGRLSAATRLCPGGYRSRIGILRLLLREMIEAAIQPETVVTMNALTERLSAHFGGLRCMTGHPLAELATNLGRWTQAKVACPPVWGGHRASLMGTADVCEPMTLRLSTEDIVAIDNFRCDIRQASGVCLSRSAIFRVTIDSFARTFVP
ncbi:MAG: hypothetical protein ACRD16_05745 [Thermoanaerobaculia bacterium]